MLTFSFEKDRNQDAPGSSKDETRPLLPDPEEKPDEMKPLQDQGPFSSSTREIHCVDKSLNAFTLLISCFEFFLVQSLF